MTIEEIERKLPMVSDPAARLPLLNELVFALGRTDPRRGLELAAEALQLAQQTGDIAAQAESFRVAAWCHETLSDYPMAMSHARQARELFKGVGDRTGEGNALIAIGVVAFGTTQFSMALEALQEARAIFSDEKNLERLASACNNIGMVYQELGKFPEALEAYLEALRINEELGNEAQAAANIGNVSNVYYYLGDVGRSFEYDQRSLAMARRKNDRYRIAHVLENISSNYKARGEYQAAFEALNEALAIFRDLEERRYEAAALIKLGMLHELRGESPLALQQYERAVAIAESIGRRDSVINAQLRTGMLHLGNGEAARAIPVLREGLAHAREAEMLKLQSDLLSVLADALDAVGQHAEAYRLIKEQVGLMEKLYGEEQQHAVARMQARFDVERAERQREVFRLRSEHLEETMERRSKELTSMAMRLVRKNAFLQKLRRQTLALAADGPTGQGVLETLQKEIIEHLQGDDEWERFEQEFQHIHHDFLARLSQRCPRLTPAELKVSAMLKSNLSNKEIAALLSVSLRNVESHRYSIRRKLGLPPGANLTAWLVAL